MNLIHVPVWEELPTDLSWKEKVALLTVRSLDGLPQMGTSLNHIFEPGKYIREMRVPAGCIVTGREHVIGHKLQLMEGSAVLFAPDGNVEFHAPAEIETTQGFVAVAYAITDIVVRTVHPNPLEWRDVTDLENVWFAPAQPMIEEGKRLQKRYLQ